MNDEPISWNDTARVYWTILWRNTAMMLAVLVPFNLLLLWLVFHRLLDRDGLLFWSKIFVVFLFLLSGFLSVRMALRKRYRGFRIQIVREPIQ
jgi:hypothetical protein